MGLLNMSGPNSQSYATSTKSHRDYGHRAASAAAGGTRMDHERFMRVALEEAQKAADAGNVGVGSVIVRDGEVVALGRNLVPTTHDPTAHAETVALRAASEILADDDMAGYSLYTTFEPCPMCCGALMNANIDSVILGGRPDSDQTRWGGYTMESLLEMCGRTGSVEVVTGILVSECMSIRQP